MAFLRLQAAAGLVFWGASFLSACAETARVAVSVPRRGVAGAAPERAVFLAAVDGGSGFEFRRQVLGGLVKSFLDSGRYSVVPVAAGADFEGRGRNVFEGIAVEDERGRLIYRRWTTERRGTSFLDAAGELARAGGADVLVLLQVASSSLAERTHHLHGYFDGSASGEAALVRPAEGTITALARERVSASSRARYATAARVQDHLASRLAESLTRSLLYEKRGELVELEDPRDGSLRRGIEFAKKGEWGEATRAWEEALSAGFHAAAAHYDIAVALRILGDPGSAREHLEAALRLDPGETRYRRAFEDAGGGMTP